MNSQSLHSRYVTLTRLSVSWSMARLYAWDAWLSFRKPPFTEADLELVIRHIQRGIRDGKRNPGALKFRNLIEDPEHFEEDLAEAMALARRPPDTDRDSVMRMTGRKPNGTVPAAVKADEILGRKAFEEFVALKKTL